MIVDTGEFRALRDQVTAIEAEVAGMREWMEGLRMSDTLARFIADENYQAGRESVLGAGAERRHRHLRSVDGGQP